MKCRICGCTYEHACNGGCSWVRNEDLCSVCDEFRDQLNDYAQRARRVSAASLKRLFEEARERFLDSLRRAPYADS
jgi:hypothetical protein